MRKISENRKKAIAARWKEYGQDLNAFRELFEKAEASPFLKGRNDRNWTADFNWLMNSGNMAKVLEGKYTGSRHPEGSRRSLSGPDESIPWTCWPVLSQARKEATTYDKKGRSSACGDRRYRLPEL